MKAGACQQEQHSNQGKGPILIILVGNAVTIIGGLTIVLASLLVVANRWLYAAEDARIGAVEGMLPRTNCGAFSAPADTCGYPGCRAFAEALIARKVLPAKCRVSACGDCVEACP